MLPLFSSGLDLTNPTHTPSPIPGSLTQPLSLDVVPPSVAPTDVIRPPDRPTTTTRRHETRRGDRLQMARTALELIGQGGLGYSFDPLVENTTNEFGDAIKALV